MMMIELRGERLVHGGRDLTYKYIENPRQESNPSRAGDNQHSPETRGGELNTLSNLLRVLWSRVE